MALALVACSDMSEAECLTLRSAAFDLLNQPHPCSGDEDCVPSRWPGCAKPSNERHVAQLAEFEAKYKKGACSEPELACPDPLGVYCDRNLCVFRQPLP
jgi:hypothetical protein